jgi:hypothetical protein
MRFFFFSRLIFGWENWQIYLSTAKIISSEPYAKYIYNLRGYFKQIGFKIFNTIMPNKFFSALSS